MFMKTFLNGYIYFPNNFQQILESNENSKREERREGRAKGFRFGKRFGGLGWILGFVCGILGMGIWGVYFL